MHHAPLSRSRLRIGDTILLGNPAWGRAIFTVVQRTTNNALILYHTNRGRRDERNRWYTLGGGRPGLRLLEDA